MTEEQRKSYLDTAKKLCRGLSDDRLRTPEVKAEIDRMIDAGELKLWEINDEVLCLKFFRRDLTDRAEQIQLNLNVSPKPLTCERNGQSIRLTESNQHLRMFRLSEEPERLQDINDYFLRAVTENDSSYFSSFLHCYELNINRQAERFCKLRDLSDECFLDLKQIYVLTLWQGLLSYTADNPYPLLVLAEKQIFREWDKYVATTCGALTIPKESSYARLRKVAAVYYKTLGEGHNESECADAVAEELSVDKQKADELIAYVKLWRYADSIQSGEAPEGEDKTRYTVYEESLTSPEHDEESLSEMRERQREKRRIISQIRQAVATLTAKERLLFTEMTGVDLDKMKSQKPKKLNQIAIKLGMADETAVDKKRKKVIEKLMLPLSQAGFLDGVKCKKISPPEDYPTEKCFAYYSYQAGFDGNTGLIVIDMTADLPSHGFRVLRSAELDTVNRHYYAYRLMRSFDEIYKSTGKLPSEKTVAWRCHNDSESMSVEESLNLWSTIYTNRFVSYSYDGRTDNPQAGYKSFDFTYQPEHTGEPGWICIENSNSHLLGSTTAYPRLADEDTVKSHIYADKVSEQILRTAYKTTVNDPNLPQKLSGEIRWCERDVCLARKLRKKQ